MAHQRERLSVGWTSPVGVVACQRPSIVRPCEHPLEYRDDQTEGDGCWWVHCLQCGKRGPKKHTRALAQARFRAVGTRVRGRVRVTYNGTAARDDRRFQREGR